MMTIEYVYLVKRTRAGAISLGINFKFISHSENKKPYWVPTHLMSTNVKRNNWIEICLVFSFSLLFHKKKNYKFSSNFDVNIGKSTYDDLTLLVDDKIVSLFCFVPAHKTWQRTFPFFGSMISRNYHVYYQFVLCVVKEFAPIQNVSRTNFRMLAELTGNVQRLLLHPE